MLQAGDERDMAWGFNRRQCRQQVADHCAIDANILSLGRLPRPCGDEHGIRPDFSERRCGLCGILQIGDNRRDTRLASRPPRQTVDRPSLIEKQGCRSPADNTARANHQCRFRHVDPPIGSVKDQPLVLTPHHLGAREPRENASFSGPCWLTSSSAESFGR